MLRKLSQVKNNTNCFTIATPLNQVFTINDKFRLIPYAIAIIPELNHELMMDFKLIIIPSHSSYG